MNEGLKNDIKDKKIRWDLLPLDILNDIAMVYTAGAEKYGDNNWQNLENGYEKYKGALLRHLYAATKEVKDEETGCYHLAQVAWNAIAMLWLHKNNKLDPKRSKDAWINSIPTQIENALKPFIPSGSENEKDTVWMKKELKQNNKDGFKD